MSKRAERRSAERAARRANHQLETAASPKFLTANASIYTFENNPDRTEAASPTHTSDARMAANRANAQKSTGPTSISGKATSSVNALKHGLTGNTVLIATDDADAYQQHLNAYVDQYKPVTLEERRLVQSIHDGAWRLDRILNLESTIYAKGRVELDLCYSELPEDQRKSFIQLEISERYSKQLRNLATQEVRIQNQRARDIKALTQLLEKRLSEEKALQAAHQQPKRVQTIGFEFGTAEITPPFPPQDAMNTIETSLEEPVPLLS